ncbi:protein-methionine-sulfoxide reductase catalytic subunit MsrP [Sulfurospirillum arcachonense]|uniref:protein-methionine-sulfoxide reductase catalytic subunit MsrP n=1 Tax=Sulfurospirillum arcachonense TaxID=57666 RepID=UPI000468B9A8|nr:protein-methionine-sulfoxide reductase catalytic subunit MsrP [Sulfurospirillum arcachonense]
MTIIKKPDWYISENEVTDEALFNKRRNFLKLGAAALVSSSVIAEKLAAVENVKRESLKFQKTTFGKGLELNSYDQASTYNNFYEFSTSKSDPAKMAHTLKPNPWDVEILGEVENPMVISLEDIYNSYPLEERIYRFRCVEGWSMVVPWIGVTLSHILQKAKPTSKAKYVKFTTLVDPKQFPDQKAGKLFPNIPYPYVEGLRMDEAMNELTFMSVGMYGKMLPNQNGAPIRLVVPWKYGFKSIKSIVSIELVEEEPLNTWKMINDLEYGFYANVNPNVDHPRWSQAKERKLGSFFKTETLMFNGYEKEVGHMYKDMDLRRYI